VVESISDGIINIQGLQNTKKCEMVEIFIFKSYYHRTICLNIKDENKLNNINLLLKKNIIKNQKMKQFKDLKFKDKINFFLIHLGKLDFNLIELKIKSSNLNIENIKITKKEKIEYANFNNFFVKINNQKIEYTIFYMNFLKERNFFYILFTVLLGKVVEVSIIYIFEGKISNYFIFYEIFIQDFFSFMNRVLNEIEVFETYLYSKDCIIPKAQIQSINIGIFKNFIDKQSIKYI
jgi:hypothetical protein